MSAVSTTIRAAAVCAAVLVFSGCTGQQQSTPATAQASTPASSEATPPSSEPVAERIIIAAEGLTVIGDDDSELARFDYYDPSAEVVDALSAHLGDPSIDTSLGDGTSGPAAYDWPGLRLVDLAGPGDESSATTDFIVVAESSAVRDIEIETADGIAVGGSFDNVVGGEPVTELENPDTGAAVSIVRVGISELPPIASQDGLNVGVQVTAHDGIVVTLASPVGNFGE